MSGPTCPNCGAEQDPGASGPCWFCRLPLDAASAVPAPPRPLPEAGGDVATTGAALAAGFIAVAVGGLLYSSGFGAAMTLVVVLPLSWVLLSMFLAPPKSRPRGTTPARGPLKAPPKPREALTPGALALRVVQVLAGAFFVMLATTLAALIALSLVCAAVMGHAH